MIKILTLIFLFILLTSQKGLSKAQLDVKMLQFNMSPVVTLLLVYDTLNQRAQQLENLMNNIAEKKKGYFKVILFDCNTDDEEILEEFIYCKGQYRKHLPALIFSEPSLNIDSKHDKSLSGVKQYTGPLDEKSLFNFAVPLMKTYSVQLKTPKDLKKFQQSFPQVPKIIFFTDKQKVSPLFKALTANFRNTIAFAHVFSNSSLVKDLNITKFPLFILNGKQKIEVKSSLPQIIERFEIIQGQPTTIHIKQYDGSSNVQLNANNLDELVYKTPQHILIHVVGEDGKDHPQWSNFTSKFHKLFNFYQTYTLKQALGVKQTPALVYFPKSVAKKAVQKTIFSPKDQFQDIYDQINSMVEDFTVPLSNYIEMQKLTSIHFQQGKFVAIYFHSKDIPMSYKAASNYNKFQEDLAFFRMKDPDQEVMDQYQIKKLPSLIIMMVDKQDEQNQKKSKQDEKEKGVKLKIATYQGRYTYSDLYQFFSSFIKQQINQKAQQQEYETETSNKVQEIKKSNKLKTKCEIGCFMLILNGSPENAEKNKNYIGVLEKQSGKMMTSSFGYIDGVCHSEFLASFDIMEDQLPAFIYIDTKFEKYSRLVGRLESSSILSFFNRIKSRKASFRGYDKLNFQNKDCAFQHQKLKKQQQTGKVISQQEAQILQQLRAQEEKKREQFQKAQKEDKTRKKGKKKRPKKQQEEEQL